MADAEFNDLEELGMGGGDELNEKFMTAANHLTKLVSTLDNDTLLKLYGFYKQGLEGDCSAKKPSWYDVKGKSKWEAWDKLKGMPQPDAKKQYIDLIRNIDQGFDVDKKPDSKEFWVTVSTMQNTEEALDECEKTIFDYVKEGNCRKVEELLSTVDDKNVLDADGLGLIHWAADRGLVDILKLLIKRNFNVNLQDVDGQTALHYASSCGQLECAQLLLKHGADAKIVDSDGSDPASVAADDDIKNLLMQH